MQVRESRAPLNASLPIFEQVSSPTSRLVAGCLKCKALLSREVTACAGMTVHAVIVAQTKIGLPYWRSKSKLSCLALERARY